MRQKSLCHPRADERERGNGQSRGDQNFSQTFLSSVLRQTCYLNGHPKVVSIFYPGNQELYPHFDLEGEGSKNYIYMRTLALSAKVTKYTIQAAEARCQKHRCQDTESANCYITSMPPIPRPSFFILQARLFGVSP